MDKINVFKCLLFMSLVVYSVHGWSSWSSQNGLGLKFGISSPQLNVQAKPNKDISNQNVDYSAHSPSSVFLNLSYRNLGITYSSFNKPKTEDRAIYGESNSTDFQLRFMGRKLTHEYILQNYTGYYISNSTEIDPSLTSNDPRIQRPDMTTQYVGANFIYTNDDQNYSMPIAYDQQGVQNDSGDSWLLFLSLSESRFQGGYSLIPSQVYSAFAEDASVLSGLQRGINLGIGYGFTLVSSYNLYFSGLFFTGGGLQEQHIQFLDQKDLSRTTPGSKSSVRFSAGYNGKNHLFALKFITDSTNIPLNVSSMNFSNTTVSAYYGYKFDGVNIPFLNPFSSWFD